MVAKKRKSKRSTLQQKYKIVKRTQEHHKKLRKGVTVGTQHNKRKKNIDRIPNAWPFKEDLLKEIQTAKDRMEDAKLRQKEKRKEEVTKRRLGLMDVEENSHESDMGSDVEESVSDHEVANDTSLGQNSRRAYLGELRKVVERSDVVLQVLDARDPNGTKSTAVEQMIKSNSRKKLVYVLNKADLVPRDVLVAWLSFLRQSHATIPFKCNTQQQKGNLGIAAGKVTNQKESLVQSNRAVGAEELLGLLKNYCRSGDTKNIISVGIVGFPNVGKSSLINSLLRTRSVGVSSMPGFTKVAQEVTLDKTIRLIDSPGIVFADGNSTTTALRNCINIEEMEDVISPVQGILEKCPQPYLMQLYSIPKFKEHDALSFLALVAKTTGKLKKGGVPNTEAVAKTVLHDWNSGKIKFYCRPPAQSTESNRSNKRNTDIANESDTKILTGFSKEFSIEQLKNDDIRILDGIHSTGSMESSAKGAAELYVGLESIGESMDL